jgi:hypothetical protein
MEMITVKLIVEEEEPLKYYFNVCDLRNQNIKLFTLSSGALSVPL